jgi:hypothetical protein
VTLAYLIYGAVLLAIVYAVIRAGRHRSGDSDPWSRSDAVGLIGLAVFVVGGLLMNHFVH